MFSVKLNTKRLLRYSPYFRAVKEYDGSLGDKTIQLPPLMSRTEYKHMFRLLSKELNYDELICKTLDFYMARPNGPLVQFVLYFLFDLVRIKLSRDVLSASHLVSEALNAIGPGSTGKWPCTYEDVNMTLSDLVNRVLARQIWVNDNTMLLKCIKYNPRMGRHCMSHRLLKQYIFNGKQRLHVESMKEIQLCSFCDRRKGTAGWGVENSRTSETHALLCCANPHVVFLGSDGELSFL